MTYRLPAALQTHDDSRALAYLSTYYGSKGGSCYTGAFFDTWAGADADRFTADDLVAVSFLSVFVPPLAARRLLEQEADVFTELLGEVGPDRDLSDEDASIDSGWPAWRLYTAVRALPGVGRTIASKLCARKRPRLIPIYDSVVGQVTAAEKLQWAPLRELLPEDGGRLQQRLLRLRAEAGLGNHISALRIYDVVTWMEGKAARIEPKQPEEQLGAELAQLTYKRSSESA